jgi:pantoate--beta-alanine ligase
VAVFGLKDAQQFLILRRMVRDLNFGIEMVGVPTVREPDGLALSSRNVYLSPSERAQAAVLSRAVAEARRLAETGEQRARVLVESMLRILTQAPDARVQYAEVVDAETLQPIERLTPGQEVLAAVAVYFGQTRLIDNAFFRVPSDAKEE